MAQGLKALAASSGHLGSIFRTHTVGGTAEGSLLTPTYIIIM